MQKGSSSFQPLIPIPLTDGEIAQPPPWLELCSVCRQALSSLLEMVMLQGRIRRYVNHHVGLISLSRAAKHCPLCSLVFNTITSFGIGSPGPDLQGQDLMNSLIGPFELSHEHEARGVTGITHISYDYGPKKLHIATFFLERLSGTIDAVSGRDSKLIPPLDQAVEWLDNCLQLHSRCGAAQNKTLPTRVIEVGESDEQVRLFTASAGATGQWLALSHCWGTMAPGSLCSKLNVSSLCERILVVELPQNFKDAITATRYLGYQNLWIDTMCIIQDDPKDWDRESGRMEYVYANAAITLAASSAPNMFTGFLSRRRPIYYAPHAHFNVKLEVHDGAPQTAILRASLDTRNWETVPIDRESMFAGPGVPRAPGSLDSRAWTFQELRLSRRILYFAETELHFQCLTHHRQESLYEPCIASGLFDKVLWFPENPNVGQVLAPKIEDFMSMTERYRELSLTRPMDILPAFSAIAARYAEWTDDEYLAGLWKKWLCVGLAWQRHHWYLHGLPKQISLDPSAPSWSWASCTGPIRYMPVASCVESYLPLAEVVSAYTTLKGTNRFGQVSGGEIVLTGWLKPLLIGIDHIERHPSVRATSDQLYGTTPAQVWREGRQVASLRFERPLLRHESDFARHCTAESLIPVELICLLIGSYALLEEANHWTALALEAIPGRPRVFRRVGLMCSKDVQDYNPSLWSSGEDWQQRQTLTWFQSGDKETITLM